MIKDELAASIEQAMENCLQFEGMTIWDHGISVSEWYMDLFHHIYHKTELEKTWILPDWVHNPLFAKKALFMDTMEQYQIYHDVGKPQCRIVDEQGKVHFPNHAEVSKQLYWESSEQTEEDKIVSDLIGMDMLAHTVKGEEREEFSKHPYAPSLLLTALAEIHSNASHLGRLHTDGFKIKAKQLDKVAKLIIKNQSS